MDPEIPVNLYDLRINLQNRNRLHIIIFCIDMTLTNPNCPVAGTMPKSVGLAIEKISTFIFNKGWFGLVSEVE